MRERGLSELNETTVGALHQLGPDGTILWANQAQLHMLGYSSEEFIGHHAAGFFLPSERFEELWRQVMLHQHIDEFETTLKCRDGSSKRVIIHPIALWQGDQFLSMRCFLRDVSDLATLQDELALRFAQIQTAELRKHEFLAMLAHELNNPLSAVLHSIATAQIDESHREHALDIARRQAEHLARIVNDLLEVGRVTQGSISLQKQPVFIRHIVEQALEEAEWFLHSDRRQLTISISPDADRVQIYADPLRIRQVITNLLHNAVQFTPPDGLIEVTVECIDDQVVIRVSDFGIGIAPETLPHVFDLFMQAEHPVSSLPGGLGVGLTLARRLIELHGGRIEAHSAGLGMGCQFAIYLSATATAAKLSPSQPPEIQPPAHLQVLIVEDNDDAAEALRLLLELFGHSATVVGSGPAALDAVRTREYSAALVDIGLPGIDGYEVARQIRRLPNSEAIILAALTGYGQEADKRQALAAGFDEHITKPVTLERLQTFLSQIP
ncbi:MAG: response regulator [Candidatus Binataceae bacterium]|nr:response regulator [Candidatus Binataceae bacterium]